MVTPDLTGPRRDPRDGRLMTLRHTAYPRTAVVIPIRSFITGKTRLAPALGPAARAELSQTMATGVVRAAGNLPVLIVSSAPEVREWARGLGLAVLDDPGTLDGAAAAGTAWDPSCSAASSSHTPTFRSPQPSHRW